MCRASVGTGQRLPLTLEDRQRCRMKRVTRLEAALQELACLRLSGSRVHRRPLRWELRATLETPITEGLRDVLTDLLAPEIVKEPPSDDFTDLCLIVGNQVLSDAPHNLRDPVLPLLIPLGHLYLTARQTDHARTMSRAGSGDRQVLDEGVERLRHPAVAVQEVEHLVEQQQDRRSSRLEDTFDRFGAWRRGLRRRPTRLDPLVARELACDVNPRGLASLTRVPRIAHEDGHLRLRHPGHAGFL